jgi:hypothetical protein
MQVRSSPAVGSAGVMYGGSRNAHAGDELNARLSASNETKRYARIFDPFEPIVATLYDVRGPSRR